MPLHVKFDCFSATQDSCSGVNVGGLETHECTKVIRFTARPKVSASSYSIRWERKALAAATEATCICAPKTIGTHIIDRAGGEDLNSLRQRTVKRSANHACEHKAARICRNRCGVRAVIKWRERCLRHGALNRGDDVLAVVTAHVFEIIATEIDVGNLFRFHAISSHGKLVDMIPRVIDTTCSHTMYAIFSPRRHKYNDTPTRKLTYLTQIMYSQYLRCGVSDGPILIIVAINVTDTRWSSAGVEVISILGGSTDKGRCIGCSTAGYSLATVKCFLVSTTIASNLVGD